MRSRCRPALALALVSIAFAPACASDDSDARTLVVSETELVVWRAVTMSAEDGTSFDADTYDATLGDVPVTVQRITPTVLGFVIPPAAEGQEASLRVHANGVEYATDALTIGPAPVVDDPAALIEV